MHRQNSESGSKIVTHCSSDVEDCVDENDLGDLRVADDTSRLAGFATAREVRAIVERSTIQSNRCTMRFHRISQLVKERGGKTYHFPR